MRPEKRTLIFESRSVRAAFADLAKLRLVVVRRRNVGRRTPAVTDIDVHEIEQAGFADVIGHLAHLEMIGAALPKLPAGDAYPQCERVADAFADALEHLHDEADALLGATAPLVGAPIRHRRQKAVAHGLVGAVHLYAIRSCILGSRRGLGVAVLMQNSISSSPIACGTWSWAPMIGTAEGDHAALRWVSWAIATEPASCTSA